MTESTEKKPNVIKLIKNACGCSRSVARKVLDSGRMNPHRAKGDNFTLAAVKALEEIREMEACGN